MKSHHIVHTRSLRILPELCVDDEYDNDCTRCDEKYGHHNNRDGNGHGLVCSQSITLCCVWKETVHNTKYGKKGHRLVQGFHRLQAKAAVHAVNPTTPRETNKLIIMHNFIEEKKNVDAELQLDEWMEQKKPAIIWRFVANSKLQPQ